MKKETRLEYKYRISLFEYYRLKSDLQGFLEFDEFTLKAQRKKYLVRSLYYDTSNFREYSEKMTGENQRAKLRFRTYCEEKENAEFVNVELKTRNGSAVTKFVDRISTDEYDFFRKKKRWLGGVSSTLIEFERRVRLGDLRPKLLVTYYREGFKPKDKSNFRLTIDHEIAFSQTNELFVEKPNYRPKDPKIILEIKTIDDGPDWIQRLVRRHSLKAVPNSKYAIGVEMTQDHIIPCLA